MIDIEREILEYLTEYYGSDTVFTDIPKDRPARFITIERTGGNFRDKTIDECMVEIQCWHETREKTASFAYEIDEIMRKMIVRSNISRVDRNSISNFPDRPSGNPRYRLVYNIIALGE